MQSRDDNRKPDEDEIEYLRRKRKFAELLLLAWGAIETYVDIIVVMEFGLSFDDGRGEFLLDIPFQKKLEFLKKRELISTDDYRVIHQFQEKRNRVFHRTISGLVFSEETREKDELMDLAVTASKTAGRRAVRLVLMSKRKSST